MQQNEFTKYTTLNGQKFDNIFVYEQNKYIMLYYKR